MFEKREIHKNLSLLIVSVFIILIFCQNAFGDELTKVHEVTDVRLILLKSQPQQILIKAEGNVPTLGWSEAHLIPYIYIVPPKDGIYEFDFAAVKPSGMAGQQITEIKASYVMKHIPDDLRGVRVKSSNNHFTKPFGGINLGGNAVSLKGTLVEGGVECPLFKEEKTGKLYTLSGNLGDFHIGDTVFLSGTIVQISFCMQGTTISVGWISSKQKKFN